MRATGGRQVWAGMRVRLEHGEGLFPDLIPRAKEMGIVVVQNPTHFDAVALVFGPTPLKFKDAQPVRSLLAGGSSGGVRLRRTYESVLEHHARVHGSEQSTRGDHARAGRDGIHADPAYAEFQEKEKGSLEPGKLADLAVLSQDIFSVPLSELPKTESVLTLVGGQVVYDAKVVRPN